MLPSVLGLGFWPQLYGFCVFEGCVGVYFPTWGCYLQCLDLASGPSCMASVSSKAVWVCIFQLGDATFSAWTWLLAPVVWLLCLRRLCGCVFSNLGMLPSVLGLGFWPQLYGFCVFEGCV